MDTSGDAGYRRVLSADNMSVPELKPYRIKVLGLEVGAVVNLTMPEFSGSAAYGTDGIVAADWTLSYIGISLWLQREYTNKEFIARTDEDTPRESKDTFKESPDNAVANFAIYTVTVSGGIFTDSVGNPLVDGAGAPITSQTLAAGTTVYLLPDTAPEGMEFDKWKIGGTDFTNSSSNSYVIARGGELKPTYKYKTENYTVSVQGGLIIRYGNETGNLSAVERPSGTSITIKPTVPMGMRFINWVDEDGLEISDVSEYTFILTKTRSITAVFEYTGDPVTLNVVNGTIQGYTGSSATVNTGGSATFIADAPPTGKQFIGWSDGTNILSADTTYTFVVDRDLTLTATYDWSKEDTVVTVVNGTIDGEGTSTSKTAQTGDSVTFIANAPHTGKKFVGWSDGTNIVSADNSYTFTVIEPITLTAMYDYTRDNVTVTVVGGSIQGDSSLSKTVQTGDSVTFIADAPSTGKKFAGWNDGTKVVSTDSTYTFIAIENTTLTATYEWSKEDITVEVIGGTINGDSSSKKTVKTGDDVTIILGEVPKGKQFAGWSNGTSIVSINAIYSFIADRSITFTATYEDREYIIGGKVIDKDGNPVSGAEVKIVAGRTEYATATTDSDGNFSMVITKPGIYNLVVEFNSIIATIIIDVTDDSTNNVIVMSSLRLNSVLDVVNNEEIVVDGLDKQFDFNDETIVAGIDKSVEVNLKISGIEKGNENSQIKEQLSNYSGGRTYDFLLRKYVKTNGTVTSSDIMSTAKNLLTFRIPLGDLSGKYEYAVLRVHDGRLQNISIVPNENGEYFELSLDKTTIILHIKNFSEYSILYKDPVAATNCIVHWFIFISLILYVAFVLVWDLLFRRKGFGLITLIVSIAFGILTFIFSFLLGCSVCITGIIHSWIALVIGVLLLLFGKKLGEKDETEEPKDHFNEENTEVKEEACEQVSIQVKDSNEADAKTLAEYLAEERENMESAEDALEYLTAEKAKEQKLLAKGEGEELRIQAIGILIAELKEEERKDREKLNRLNQERKKKG